MLLCVFFLSREYHGHELPLIAGELIEARQEVPVAPSSGALAVSTGKRPL